MNYPIILERRPTRIRAMRWTGENYPALRSWGAPVSFLGTPQPTFDEFDSDKRYDLWLWVEANHAQLRLEVGEWIAKDEIGFYPIKDQMIRKNYREVTSMDVDDYA